MTYVNIFLAGDKKEFLSLTLLALRTPRVTGLTTEVKRKEPSMQRIFDEALRELKARVGEIVGNFIEKGLSPQALSKFEHELHGNLGDPWGGP